MPHRDIMHEKGRSLAPDLRSFLEKSFSQDELRRLERYGGRVRVAIAAPFVERKEKNVQWKATTEVIASLREMEGSPQRLESTVSSFTVKQLREIAKAIDCPVRSGDSADQIRAQLVSALRSDRVFRGIVGRPTGTGAQRSDPRDPA